MKEYGDNFNNIFINTLIVVVIIAIIVVIFLLLFNPSQNKKLYCTARLDNNIPTNQDIKIIVNAYGKNASIQTNDGLNTGKNMYEETIGKNGTYTFYATNGSSKESCSVVVNNIDKVPPTGNVTIDSDERNLAAKLTINASDDVALADLAYSWDNKSWSRLNYLVVSSNGTYYGYVKDRAGNIAKLSYNVTNIGNPVTTKKVSMFTNTSLILKVDEGTVKTWKSNNSNVVKVDDTGRVTANIAGTATVTAILTNDDIYEFVISVTKTKVTSISLNNSNVKIKPKATAQLSIISIKPDNARCDTINWSSNNSSVATVNGGLVTGIKDGSAIITVSCDGVTSQANIVVKSTESPIVPTSATYKYEGSTLKYYVQNNYRYYLTYIWMEDPYNQIKKLDSNTAQYGTILTDDQLNGKTLVRKNVGEMVNLYVSKGLISASKGLIAFNASGFYVKGAWEPPSDYYNLRSDSWLVLNDGKVTRNRMTDGARTRTIIGISATGDLKIYPTKQDVNYRQIIYNAIMNDKVKNTFSFSPELVKNGVSVSSGNVGAQRQAICQVNSNNYIMLTTMYNMTIGELGPIFVKLGCQTAFNLDGGGSTSLFYKKAGTSTSTKIKCSDGTNGGTCRSIIEGIYFVEK